MSFGKVIKGYGTLLSSLLSFLTIALTCVVVGFVISYPLWLLATKNQAAYTIVSIGFFSCAIIFLLIDRMLKEYKKSPLRLFISLGRKITAIGGLALFFFLILNFYKISAFLVLTLTIILYGILAFGISQNQKQIN